MELVLAWDFDGRSNTAKPDYSKERLGQHRLYRIDRS